MRSLSAAIFVASFLLILQSEAKTIKVPQDFAKIQLAINAAVNDDTVLVAEGTYMVNLFLNKKIVLGSHYLIDGDESHIAKTILNGSTPINQDSGSVIVLGPDTDTTAIIIGLTITGGTGTLIIDQSNGRRWLCGGGIFSNGNGVKILHNRIVDNPVLSRPSEPYTFGGGLCIGLVLNHAYFNVIEDNIIANNIVTGTQAEGAGFTLGTRARIARNIIEKNTATAPANNNAVGGISIWPGAGDVVEIRENIIRENSSSNRGGGVVVYRPTSAGGAIVTMTNNLIVGNTAATLGGAIDLRVGCRLTLVNNTIADNSAGGQFSSGLFIGGTGSFIANVTGINNIFWDKNPEFSDVYGARFESMHNNLIRGESSIGENNFSADPMFAADGSYRLTAASPCIGAGTTSREIFGTTITSPSTDLTGAVRSSPSGSMPDIGAIESDFATTTSLRPNRAEVRKFNIGGITRHHIVFRPKGRESEINRPVLIHLTGYDDAIDYEINYIRFHLYGDTAGFVTVYPEAYQRRWNSTAFEINGWPTSNTDDVAYISALIDTLRAQYSIDTTRVFVSGWSNGGTMANLIATKLAHRITAACVVDGALTPTIVNGYSPKRPVPIMILNGTEDPYVPYTGGGNRYTVEQTVGIWQTWNNATVRVDSTVMDGNSNDQSSVLRVRYYGSRVDTPLVVFYRIDNGGHEWPGAPPYFGSGTINRDIDASAEAMKLFIISKPISTVVGIKELTLGNPTEFALSQNYPNPFNPSTMISYQLPITSKVNLKIFDLLGREIASLVNEEQSAGWKEVQWNATNFASGMYLVRMTAGNFTEAKKILLMK
ncbi:MAG: T9SS type A sorting domain-containing protein [Bacteroidota bacterium]